MAQSLKQTSGASGQIAADSNTAKELQEKPAAIKVVHIITGLDVGGAEMMLYQLLGHIDKTMFDSEVISLTDIGPVGEKIQSLGVPIRSLKMNRSGLPNPVLVRHLAQWLKKAKPDIVQTWMYHADLLGTLAARLAGNPPVIWNIQHGLFHLGSHNPRTLLVAKACGRLSRRPIRVVSCSAAACQSHQELGYAADKITVIPNGSNTAVFRPNPEARQAIRCELGIDNAAPLIGMVGRFNPQKDHHNFIQAAIHLHQVRPEVQYLLCGLDLTWENSVLASWIPDVLRSSFHLLGRRLDIEQIDNALDIGCLSSSHGEGFPMAVGEMMACGVPCVVTDVGDCALLVGETGRVVPARNPEALSEGWQELIEMGTQQRILLGQSARQRVETHFSISKVTAQYEALYREVAKTTGTAKTCVD